MKNLKIKPGMLLTNLDIINNSRFQWYSLRFCKVSPRTPRCDFELIHLREFVKVSDDTCLVFIKPMKFGWDEKFNCTADYFAYAARRTSTKTGRAEENCLKTLIKKLEDGKLLSGWLVFTGQELCWISDYDAKYLLTLQKGTNNSSARAA